MLKLHISSNLCPNNLHFSGLFPLNMGLSAPPYSIPTSPQYENTHVSKWKIGLSNPTSHHPPKSLTIKILTFPDFFTQIALNFRFCLAKIEHFLAIGLRRF